MVPIAYFLQEILFLKNFYEIKHGWIWCKKNQPMACLIYFIPNFLSFMDFSVVQNHPDFYKCCFQPVYKIMQQEKCNKHFWIYWWIRNHLKMNNRVSIHDCNLWNISASYCWNYYMGWSIYSQLSFISLKMVIETGFINENYIPRVCRAFCEHKIA